MSNLQAMVSCCCSWVTLSAKLSADQSAQWQTQATLHGRWLRDRTALTPTRW